jgi:hypothetical protein
MLPLLFSVGLPALVGSGALGAGTFLAGLSAPALAGIGAGLGSLLQTGDLGEGIKTGLTSFLGGKLLGGLSATPSQAAATTATTTGVEAAKPGFLQAALGPSPSITEAMKTAAAPKFLSTFAPNAGAGITGLATAATLPGVLPAAFIGQNMADYSAMTQRAREGAEEDEDTRPPMPRPMSRTLAQNPFEASTGEGLYFQYQRPPAPPGYEPEYPYYYQKGGIVSLRRMQEGGEVMAEPQMAMPDAGMNEKEVIVEAIRAIKGVSENPEIALGMFVQKYGEDALRDLVSRVQSGEFDQTVEESEGMIRGPGDGMDDMVPANVEGEEDVLLADNEYIVPADVVSGLGNGSSDAGARELDRMLERVRMARTGTPEQAPQIDTREMLPV